RAAALQDVGDARARQRLELAREQARVPAPDADHLELPAEGMAYDGADRGVHPGCVAATGEDTDPSHGLPIAEPMPAADPRGRCASAGGRARLLPSPARAPTPPSRVKPSTTSLSPAGSTPATISSIPT